jgi:hypothetical protein
MRRGFFIAGLVLATLALAALGVCLSVVRSVRATLAPSLTLERSTAL